ncbi:uncharacterized protein BXZ73DRAFT_108562 [Epithele typhae]|uniref:uncharacterized protein n=1 Tax=Epithele typhae TaxID=378194 RepID=UPI002007BCB0|nr:uncharacterized protein BXZ73DRAFT_108562 [Epithele typhae]KAH9910724.1 hypothetical protein BXZ73DRAFT_108562 [Epithele typhae]
MQGKSWGSFNLKSATVQLYSFLSIPILPQYHNNGQLLTQGTPTCKAHCGSAGFWPRAQTDQYQQPHDSDTLSEPCLCIEVTYRMRGSSPLQTLTRQDPEDDSDEEPEDIPYYSDEWLAKLEALNAGDDVPERIKKGVKDIYFGCRSIIRMAGMYTPFSVVLPRAVIEYGRDPEVCVAVTTKKGNTMARYRDVFPIIFQYLDEFEDHIPYLKQYPKILGKLSNYISQLRVTSRSDDISRSKMYLTYYVSIPVTPTGETDIIEDKSRRGYHDVYGCASLLVPIGKEYRAYLADPEGYCRQVNNGQRLITPDHFPRVFYDLDMLKDTTVPIHDAFLRSNELLKFYRALYLGPKAEKFKTSSSKPRGQKSVAAKSDTAHSTVHSIIYAASLLRFTLSSQQSWEETDVGWVNELFSNAVLDLGIRKPDWKSDLLEFYDREIFSPVAEARDHVMGADPDSAFAIMMAA